jgi:hypothetical protein
MDNLIAGYILFRITEYYLIKLIYFFINER